MFQPNLLFQIYFSKAVGASTEDVDIN